ncbi:MAG: hypothetical protein VXW41_10690, partial [SAR324 cluster bacterium]|nr:hypothetical protein [SAR324 cluster bacterium]
MGASLVGDDVWEYQSSEYQEAPSYPKLTLLTEVRKSTQILCFAIGEKVAAKSDEELASKFQISSHFPFKTFP